MLLSDIPIKNGVCNIQRFFVRPHKIIWKLQYLQAVIKVYFNDLVPIHTKRNIYVIICTLKNLLYKKQCVRYLQLFYKFPQKNLDTLWRMGGNYLKQIVITLYCFNSSIFICVTEFHCCIFPVIILACIVLMSDLREVFGHIIEFGRSLYEGGGGIYFLNFPTKQNFSMLICCAYHM